MAYPTCSQRIYNPIPSQSNTSKPKSGAKGMLEELAFLLHCATAANNGLPPASAAWDNGGSNVLVNGMFLGMVPTAYMAEFEFFKSCTKKSLAIPMWPYKGIFHDSTHYIGGCNDSNHVFKRYAFHVTSGVRMVRIGAFMVQLTPMVAEGLSARALGGDDIQNDADMSRKLNPNYVPDSWCGRGIMFYQFLNSLMVSFWNACEVFSAKECLFDPV